MWYETNRQRQCDGAADISKIFLSDLDLLFKNVACNRKFTGIQGYSEVFRTKCDL